MENLKLKLHFFFFFWLMISLLSWIQSVAEELTFNILSKGWEATEKSGTNECWQLPFLRSAGHQTLSFPNSFMVLCKGHQVCSLICWYSESEHESTLSAQQGILWAVELIKPDFHGVVSCLAAFLPNRSWILPEEFEVSRTFIRTLFFVNSRVELMMKSYS